MKRTILALAILFSIAGCNDKASYQEVVAAVNDLPDCVRIFQVIMFGNGSGVLPATVISSNPEIDNMNENKESSINCSNIVIYKTKNGSFRVATLNQDRPPKITGLSREYY